MRAVQTQRVPVPIVGPSGALRSLDASAARSINVFPEINAEGTENVALFGAAGFEQVASLGGTGHGLALRDGVLLAFAGEDVFEIASNGTTTNLGTIAGMGRVRTASNGSQLAVASDGVSSAYIVDSSAVTEVTDADLLPVRDVAFINSRFVFLNEDGGQFQWSDLLAGLSYDGLNFATAEGQPDDATGILSDGRQLYIGGERTIETFYDAGTTFARTPQAVASKGVVARDSFVLFDNAPTFLGADDENGVAVYRLVDGFNVARLSTNAVDTAIRGYSETDKAFAFTYSDGGHSFYVLTFPNQATWVYDAATQLWHERRSYGQPVWDVVAVRRAYGRLMALTMSGDVVELKPSLHRESGEVMERIRITPPFAIDGRRFTVHRIEIECETGGHASASELSMELSISKDRGRTWGPFKRASIGRSGQFQRRVIFRQLGAFRDVVLQIRQTDDAPVAWLRAWADVEVHAS